MITFLTKYKLPNEHKNLNAVATIKSLDLKFREHCKREDRKIVKARGSESLL